MRIPPELRDEFFRKNNMHECSLPSATIIIDINDSVNTGDAESEIDSILSNSLEDGAGIHVIIIPHSPYSVEYLIDKYIRNEYVDISIATSAITTVHSIYDFVTKSYGRKHKYHIDFVDIASIVDIARRLDTFYVTDGEKSGTSYMYTIPIGKKETTHGKR